MTNEGHIISPTINLPKGGGAIKGIGETFQPHSFTGTASLSIPIPFTEARALTPTLSLTYSSGSGNSPYGLGFSLALPNISRRTDKGIPEYTDSDTFILAGSDHLVPALQKKGNEWVPLERIEHRAGNKYQVKSYRPRTEGLFAKIEKWVNVSKAESHWEITTKENVLNIYGRSRNAQIAESGPVRKVFQWNLEETKDAKGNRVLYQYKIEDSVNLNTSLQEKNRNARSNTYLHRVLYGNYFDEQGDNQWAFQTVLNYGEYDPDHPAIHPDRPGGFWSQRQDSFSSYRSGFEIRTHRLCRSILVFHHFKELGPEPQLVKALHLEYDENPNVTFLKSVWQTGYKKLGGRVESKDTPPVSFGYSRFQPQAQAFQALTFEGHALPGYNNGQYLAVDLYREGIAGILYSDEDTTLYYPPLGAGRYAAPEVPENLPVNKNLRDEQYALTDLGGDGSLDLVLYSQANSGYYAFGAERSWQSFRPFDSWPLNYYNDRREMVDLDGDGLTDLLVNETDDLLCYYSEGKKGYRPATRISNMQKLPVPREGSEEELVLFADVFGDGLDHRVRVRNGSVVCWPNLGYGRFAPPVSFANAPYFTDQFEAARLHFADLDGTGTTDMIYLYADRAAIYFNQSGKQFSEPLYLPLPETYDRIDQVNFADILGNGTTCMVLTYTSPEIHHFYYDFSAGAKPHLLVEVDNNMGAVTRIRYQSSTHFYLKDRQEGKTWATILPTPVQVIEKTESIDQISGTKLVSRFAYHHGHYDGWEREFRGFGMVERWDTEAFEQYHTRDLLDLPFATVPEGLHAVPVYSKTWYHTGVFLREGLVSKQFRDEYYQGDARALYLPDSVFERESDQKDTVSHSEAYRALQGMVLRKEVFGLDYKTNPELVLHPYNVTESNSVLRLIQPRANNNFAVYQLLARENISYQYERNPLDPRIKHDFNIEYDQFGQLLNSCSVAYPRRNNSSSVRDFPEQKLLLATCTSQQFIDNTEAFYLLSVPLESRTFEIGGLRAEGHYFSFNELKEQLNIALENPITFSDQLNNRHLQGRLLSWERFYYWRSSSELGLPEKAPFGFVDELSLLHSAETAFHSQKGLHSIFSEQIEAKELDELLTRQGGGGYVLKEDHWWNPNTVAYYGDSSSFYQMLKTEDPFGAQTILEYDSYFLFTLSSVDPLGNRVRSQINYAVVQTEQVIDANNNIEEVVFDPLGQVIITSIQGEELNENGETILRGDRPVLEYTSIPEPEDLHDLLRQPHRFLQGGSSFFFYDLFAWKDAKQPLYSINILRERHGSELSLGEETHLQFQIAYSDGFGRPLQLKKKTEPGPARILDSIGNIQEVEAIDRWLTSERIVYNNKGNPVKQYEPYYSTRPTYESEINLIGVGVSPVLHYDPLQRVYRKDFPKGFHERIVFSPWEVHTFDANDTIRDSLYFRFYEGQLRQEELSSPMISNLNPVLSQDEKDALNKTLLHDQTPSIQILDVLARPFRSHELKEIDGEELVTYRELDIVGNILSETDPRFFEKTPTKNFQINFDMRRQVLKTLSADGGGQWHLVNAMDVRYRHWNSRGILTSTFFDLLQRPVRIFVESTQMNQLVEEIRYGEDLPDAANRNARGKTVIHFDQAGMTHFSRYSFKGELLEVSRDFREGYKKEVNWNSKENPALPDNHPWQSKGFESPDATLPTFTNRRKYDALGRVIEDHQPLEAGAYLFRYHASGRLAAVDLLQNGQNNSIVKQITYDAKDQRQSITYANQVKTKYTYDPDTFSLIGIHTTRLGKTLQNIRFTFDPALNITRQRDLSQPVVFHANTKIEPVSDYTYDGLYRLVQAKGRHKPNTTNPRNGQPDYSRFIQVNGSTAADDRVIQNYIRKYTYDNGGNLTKINEQNGPSREFVIDQHSNRSVLKAINRPADFGSIFDAQGNQLELDHLAGISWNYRNNIAHAAIVSRKNGPSDLECYVYDSTGQRTRKVAEFLENDGAKIRIEEKIYLGYFEMKRTRYEAFVVRQTIDLHQNDGQHLLAVQRNILKGQKDGEEAKTLRYQIGNFLESATLEINEEGNVLTYEEFYPYGGTALIAGRSLREVSEKEYRYSKKEKDINTGLYYYGARYYAAWLGRWLSPDPAGNVDGLNLYVFVKDNPIIHIDEGGLGHSTGGLRSGKSWHGNAVPKGNGRPRERIGYHYPRYIQNVANQDPFVKSIHDYIRRSPMGEGITVKIIEHLVTRSAQDPHAPLTTEDQSIINAVHAAEGDVSRIPFKELGISRNHRLANSSITTLMELALSTAVRQGGIAPHQQPLLKDFFEVFDSPLNETNSKDAMDAFQEAIDHGRNNDIPNAAESLQKVIDFASFSVVNLRFGDSEINEIILHGFDPNMRGNAISNHSASIRTKLKALSGTINPLIDPGLIRSTLEQVVKIVTAEPQTSSSHRRPLRVSLKAKPKRTGPERMRRQKNLQKKLAPFVR